MFIVENYTTAVLLCLVTMLCWGSWANTQKLAAAHWRFELFYWDYVIGIFLTALLFAVTLGSVGDAGRAFWDDLRQADSRYIGSALLGGVIFNAANILLGASIAIAGMAVAFPVGIGLALVLGVLVNYADTSVGNPAILFAGVGLIVVAILLNAFAYRRAAAQRRGTSTRGLVLAVIAGFLMGYFYKYVAASMYADFTQPEPGKLSPYTAVVVFGGGVLLSNLLFNTLLMARPFVGAPVHYADYFRGRSRDHLMGLLGGAIWCVGMALSIIASGAAGPAISYGLGQGATVIAALWGIFIWREFQNAPKGTSTILSGMILCYIIGLGLLIAAR